MKKSSPTTILAKIQRLQEAATSDSTSVPELLRMAWVIAVGLGLEKESVWIRHELDGYPVGLSAHELPDYRHLRAEPVADNSPWGWIPLVLHESDFQSSLPLTHMATSVIDLAIAVTNNEDMIFPLPNEVNRLIRRKNTSFDESPIRAGRKLRSHQLKQVLERVRSRILEWSIGIEERLNLPPSSPPELQVPVTNNFHIQNAQGVFGVTNNSTINQTNSLNQERFDALAAKLRENNVLEGDIEGLRTAILTDPPSPSSHSELGPQVQVWVGKMLFLALNGAWSIAANTAGSLLATAIGNYYGWS